MAEKGYNQFVDYVIKDWEGRGKVTNVKETKEIIDTILWLMSQYRLKCLLGTIIDIDDLSERFESQNKIQKQEQGG